MFHDYMGLERTPAVHHEALIAQLQLVADGELDRLLILMPPGHAKTHYASVEFPAFVLGKYPDWPVIGASYGTDLAADFGGRVRDIVNSEEYRTLFPSTQIRDDTRAKDDWRTTKGGRYFAAGVGRGITGRRGKVAILDDLIKDRKEADSITVRESTWSWYLSALRTRLLPGAAIVMIATRWHEDDPAGRILPKEWNGESGWITARDGERWYVLCLAAQAREHDPLGRSLGEWLWPDFYPPQFYESQRRALGPREWSALYQQAPSPEEGTFFKREWFKWYDPAKVPAVHTYAHSDYAVTEDDDGDWTELMVSGLDANDDLYLAIGAWSGQTAPDVWIDAELDLIAKHKPLIAFGEGGVIRRAVEPFQTKRSRERRVYCRREWLASITDKLARARGLQARSAAGKVYLPENDAGHRLLMHLLAFPAAAEDHTVDACSLLCRGLDQMVAGAKPAGGPAKRKLRDYDMDREDTRSWRTA